MCVSVKKRRNWHRHDYSEIDDGSKVKILNLLTVEFLMQLSSLTEFFFCVRLCKQGQ